MSSAHSRRILSWKWRTWAIAGRAGRIRDINQPTTGAGWTPDAIAACVNGDPANGVAPFSALAREVLIPGPNKTRAPSTANFRFSLRFSRWATSTAPITTLSKPRSHRRNFHGLTRRWLGYTYSHALDASGGKLGFRCGVGVPADSTQTNRE